MLPLMFAHCPCLSKIKSNILPWRGLFACRERGPTVLLPGGNHSPHPFCVLFFFFFNVPHISTMLTTALYVFCLCSSSTAHNSGRFFERGKGEGAVLCFTILIARLALLCDHREGKKPLRCKNSTIFSIQKGQTQTSQKIQWSLE